MSHQHTPPEEPSSINDSQSKEQNDFVRGFSQISQVGFSIFACILIGVFIGRFLDNSLGTSPWLLLVFSFLGVGAAFKYLYDLSKRL